MESVTDGRRRRSGRTRQKIVEAADQRFVEQGFVPTTIEQIARAAGVSPQTVYYGFGTKVRVLAAVLDARIAGHGVDRPVLDRDWAASLGTSGSAAEAIEALTGAATAIFARAAPVYEVVRRASSDPEVGALLTANRQARRSDQRQLIAQLHDAGLLPPSLEVDAAADAMYAVLNEEVFQLLVVDCGWTTDRFQRWLSVLLQQQLLDPVR